MKKFLLILVLIVSCTTKESKPKELVRAYYKGFKNLDYKQVKETLANSLSIIEGDYIMNFTPDSFYEQFKWDSVFKPIYNVVELQNRNEYIIATVSVNSLKFEFLKNNPLTCIHKFHFESGKISKIENLDCPDANWVTWQKERDSLVKWIKLKHPELDGFVNDLSMQGAVNYTNAIDLYQKR